MIKHFLGRFIRRNSVKKGYNLKLINTNFPSRSLVILVSIWLFSVLTLASSLAIATNLFRRTVQATTFGNSLLFLILLLGSMLLGSLAYGLGVLDFVYGLVKRSGSGNFIIASVKYVLILIFLPLYLFLFLKKFVGLVRSFKLGKTKLHFKKAYKPIIVGIFITSIFPIWLTSYFLVGFVGARQLGMIEEPISIVGTGSMYPTFPKGQGKTLQELSKEVVGTPGMLPYPNGLNINGIKLFNYQISRGDIVVFINDKTKELTQKLYGRPSGFIKRIIGLPGDSIELKEGIVYLNDKPFKEPYTAKARSTFGEGFLSECKRVTIPSDSVFVMGDNRKGSGDSREIGFVNIKDIDHVLPIKSQVGVLEKNWRDTSKDFDEASKIKLDEEKYLDLLNQKRKEAGVQLLKYQPKLEISASKRGAAMLKYDDLSYEATRSEYTMSQAMSDSGYNNITYGEAPQLGYYEADELIENQFEFPETKKFLLNKDYQEVGIAEVEGQLNGCPAQVVVLHFAGYVPPNYNQEDTESWKTTLSQLEEIQPGWNRLKESGDFYKQHQKDADRINEIISIRISHIEAIISRMGANQWFTQQEKDYINQDKSLYDEQQSLANKLNGR